MWWAGERALMELHDLAGKGQAYTASALLLFGGVEWHENLLYYGLRYFRAVVGNGNYGIASGLWRQHRNKTVLNAFGSLNGISYDIDQSKWEQTGIHV